MQNENGNLVETIARLKAENTILFQKKRRLDSQLEGQNKEIRSLQTSMSRLGIELSRINGLIAQNSSAREALKVRVDSRFFAVV